MKICEFCGSSCEETVKICPSCGGDSFRAEGVQTAPFAVSDSEAQTREIPDQAPFSKSGCSLVLLIFLWVAIFPLPLTIWVVRKRDWKKWLKTCVIIAAWAVYAVICLQAKQEVDRQRKREAIANNTTVSTTAESSYHETGSSVEETPAEEEEKSASDIKQSGSQEQNSSSAQSNTSRDAKNATGVGNDSSRANDGTSSASSGTTREKEGGSSQSSGGSWTEEDTDF